VGEDLAVAYLEEQGYEIVARNVATKAGEIDIVATHGVTLCFIEVKARHSTLHGSAIEAVNRRKQTRLVRSAALYLAQRFEAEQAVRFDVLGLECEGGDWRCTLIQNAFEAGSLFLV